MDILVNTLGFFFDPRMFDGNYWLMVLIPSLLLGLFAQWRVKAAFAKTSQIPAGNGMTGAQAAQAILDDAGITEVTIEPVQGRLTDHYDPRNKVLRLSPDVYGGRSVAAMGIAAHEVGHAVQDAVGYAPLVVRNAIVPVAGIGSNLGFILIFIGLIVNMTGLAWAGVALFAAVVVFQLVNLPVEFDASKRARDHLLGMGLVTVEEDGSVKKVLNAAAMTYVAATIGAVLHLLYYIMLIAGSRD